jgi:hypothetical protein
MEARRSLLLPSQMVVAGLFGEHRTTAADHALTGVLRGRVRTYLERVQYSSFPITSMKLFKVRNVI